MKLVKDSDAADNWRLVAAAELRHVATVLEFEQLPKLSPYAAASVQDVVAQLRCAADGLIAGRKS